MDNKTVTIRRDEHIRLMDKAERYDRLVAGGVEEWEGYETALNPPGWPSVDSMTQVLSDYWLK